MLAMTTTASTAPALTITLLDLVSELTATGATDCEVVAAVMDLIETRRVRLIGQICEEHLLEARPGL
jgi:hypothetical protein